MTESERARLWREAAALTREDLGNLIGYSAQAIGLFEVGHTPPRTYQTTRRAKARGGPRGRQIDPKVWKRYKAACAGVDAYVKEQRRFDW